MREFHTEGPSALLGVAIPWFSLGKHSSHMFTNGHKVFGGGGGRQACDTILSVAFLCHTDLPSTGHLTQTESVKCHSL